MPNLLASAHCCLSRAMRRMLIGLGVLDWRPTQFYRRDLGPASGTIPWRLSSSGPKSGESRPAFTSRGLVASTASVGTHRSEPKTPIGLVGDDQQSNCPGAGAIPISTSGVELRLTERAGATVAEAIERGGQLAIELTTHPSDTTVLHPSPTTSAP